MSPGRETPRRKTGLQAPLIGKLIRRSGLSRCAREAAAGDALAVVELCEALDSGDQGMVSLAREALSALPVAGQEICCSQVISRENRPLADLCREQGYAPRDPQGRALFCLLSGQYDALSSSADTADLLARSYRPCGTVAGNSMGSHRTAACCAGGL
ncbi:MAG: hypothetical protein GKC06_02075 [Methanomicrobiales archaeon]|nr:hypothetical protein [Methanomicrobiales archaeon]